MGPLEFPKSTRFFQNTKWRALSRHRSFLHTATTERHVQKQKAPAHHLAQVLVRLGLVAASLVRRHLLPLGGELPAPLARVHVRRVVLVEALAGEVVPLAAALALDVVLPGTEQEKNIRRVKLGYTALRTPFDLDRMSGTYGAIKTGVRGKDRCQR